MKDERIRTRESRSWRSEDRSQVERRLRDDGLKDNGPKGEGPKRLRDYGLWAVKKGKRKSQNPESRGEKGAFFVGSTASDSKS